LLSFPLKQLYKESYIFLEYILVLSTHFLNYRFKLITNWPVAFIFVNARQTVSISRLILNSNWTVPSHAKVGAAKLPRVQPKEKRV
jgi:hypothetical protein